MTDKRFTMPQSHPRDPYYYDGKGNGGGLPQRRVTRLTTPPVSGTTGKVSGTIQFPGVAGATLLSFAAAQDTWLRLYATAADREADRLRDIDTFPPTTPIIFDGLVKKGTLAGMYDRTRWGPGPGCTSPGYFGYSTDGDGSTFWGTDIYLGTGHPAAADMSVGDTYSVDFGEQILVGSVALRNGTTALGTPLSFSVEVSTNGTTWKMVVPSYVPATGQADSIINFSASFNCRYIRLVALTVAGVGSGAWCIAEFSAYATDEDSLRLRLWNGDEEGIPCFNYDDAAQDMFYYAAQCDPDVLYNIYFAAFGYRACDLYSWSLDSFGRLIVTKAESSFEDCILTGELPPLGGNVSYSDPGGLRPRYFNIAQELRAFGVGGIIKIGAKPSSLPAAVGQLAFTRSSAIDTAVAAVGICYYVSDVGAYSTSPHLSIGIERTSSTTIRGIIQWRNAAGTNIILATGSNITCGLGSGGTLTTSIATDDDDNVIAVCSINGVQQCTALVPSDLLALVDTHNYCGFYSDASNPAGADLAWGGIGINAIQIAGGYGNAVIDIGYVPMEAPGGTLKRPA